MRFVLLLPLLLLAFSIRPALTAPKVAESHSHNGRVHSHILPTTGIKHFHKHMHNGRAHIHPFSKQIGFNHTHNTKRRPIKKSKINPVLDELHKVEHKHGGRPHSHVLPPSGLNHFHRHWHGKRAHSHSLEETGAVHFHPEMKEKSSKTKKVNFDQQVAELLKKPVKTANVKKKKKKYVPKKRLKNSKKKLTKKKIKPNRNKSQQIKEPEIKEIDNDLKEEDTANIVSAKRQYEIGLRYEKGEGTSINLEQAFKWYTRAALQGNARAQFNLASLYEDGRGVKRNLEQAVKWYRKAAENKCDCTTKSE